MNIIINIEEEIITKKHISYYVKIDNPKITLYEIYESYYTHPNSKTQALISRIETEKVKSYNVNELKAAPLMLLYHALNNINIKEITNVY
jgi:hypothetical protein